MTVRFGRWDHSGGLIKVQQSDDGSTWLDAGTFQCGFNCIEVSSTFTPALSEAPIPTPSSGIGDPHLQNMLGQQFDLMRAGTSVLVSVPRGTPDEDALLLVKADARQLGAQCSDMYFQEINITGAWANKAQPGGFQFHALGDRDEKPKWVKLGPLEFKVSHGHTDKVQKYLNVYVKNLGRAGFLVGGLLGSDDHAEAATPEKKCMKTLALKAGPHGRAADRQGSVAVGY